MSQMSGGAGPTGLPGASGSGMPDESDLPRLQGLDEAVDDPSDPQAARRGEAADEVPFDPQVEPGDGKATSDPMPDMSGTSGTGSPSGPNG